MSEDYVEIPYQELKDDVLEGIIKEFVLREGTDYGSGEYSLEQKVVEVKNQLKSGKARVIFDPNEESCNIVMSSSLR